MDNKAIMEFVEKICDALQRNMSEGMKILEQFIPVLQEKLGGYMVAGIEHGITQENWLEVLKDILEGMENGDVVLLVDSMQYGLRELLCIASERDEL